ncbi:UNVERIFIED_CONTAM: alpha/beta hydrolase [Halobacillus marinus]
MEGSDVVEPVGYFVTALLYASGVCFAVVPRKWALPFRSPGKYLLMFTELPFHLLLFLFLSTFLAVIEGDMHSVLGPVSFVIMAASAAAVLWGISKSLKTASILRHAFDEHLEGWRRTGAQAGIRHSFSVRAFLGPFQIWRGVKRTRNIAYADKGSRNRMDLYRHKRCPDRAPVLIHLHGGGFVSGKKSTQSLPMIQHFVKRGWVCISANYRLLPNAEFPEPLIDVKKLIAWVRRHAGTYNIDPDKIVLAGNSAGGHLATMAALTVNDPVYQPGFEEADTTIAAAISFYGYYGRMEMEKELSSPLNHDAKDAPPFFLVHGDRDTYVSQKGARRLSQHIAGSSVHPVVYVELPGAEHNFDLFHSIRAESISRGAAVFTEWVINR